MSLEDLKSLYLRLFRYISDIIEFNTALLSSNKKKHCSIAHTSGRRCILSTRIQGLLWYLYSKLHKIKSKDSVLRRNYVF